MDPTRLFPELQFQFARSGGKGGQNVNKVASKAELYFDIPKSAVLTEEEKAVLLDKLSNKLTSEGVLVLYHQTDRSQLVNRDKVTEKFYQLIRKAFEKPKPRKATRPTKASLEEKKQEKQRRGEVKAGRRKVDY
ncbi:alternative ribosome rescue aminoacyl-tRNA hydrolase ArfB [Larkinella arboricola]|uniref:Ribosome-associated protein n=1 Tax=Larkinella arboricola TaxID=643671 RepID=A0A327WQ59_LARAB|nr:alternative ribosome rescue aminoacyl-tRNA hydrolase ArfB [Larkinella arboricola]RAJ94050.1 ribosome-associated protein [Larkinella arboricola]